MNREIKFRGKIIETNSWYEGQLFCNKSGQVYIIPKIFHWAVKEAFSKSVGQFTGLTDKNGKEIYEGDILQDSSNKYVILWDTDDARFVSVNMPDYILDTQTRFDEKKLIWVLCEIIGNIHDNPELLK